MEDAKFRITKELFLSNPKNKFTKLNGTCLLTSHDDAHFRLYELPNDPPLPELMKPVLDIPKTECIYSMDWYPKMSSMDPVTSVFLSTARASPIHLLDAFNGFIRATYRCYDEADEVTAAMSVKFDRTGGRIYAGLTTGRIDVFDTAIPGRDPLLRYGKGQIGLGMSKKNNEIVVWDLRNPGKLFGILKRTVETNQRIHFHTLDNDLVISGNTDGSIKVYDLKSSPVIVNDEPHIYPIGPKTMMAILKPLNPFQKKKTNQGDEDGMTPTLWAAFEGNLETLRFLIGKGGHMDCTEFLVNFGINVWALDIDLHTARELSGMNGQAEVLAYLDSIHNKLEKSPLLNYRKCHNISRNVNSTTTLHPNGRNEYNYHNDIMKDESSSSKKKNSLNNNFPLTYSEMTGTLSMERKQPIASSSLIFKKLQRYNNKVSSSSWNQEHDQFKIRSKDDDGTLKITNLSGYRRDSEIIFVAPPTNNTSTEVPSEELNYSHSQQTPRRKEIAGILRDLEEGSIGSAGSFAERIDFDESSSSLEEDEVREEEPRDLEEIDVLLASLNLSEFSSLFQREKVDLEALLLLNDEDLKSMSIPIGPRRKLLKAISERKDDIQHSIVMEDSSL
ncbi:USH1G [Lepeophtheirus salmonis]|uniref:USH1G n=1 Tax=Lepeophtheirus salmonis TaxID=72036 RepID=A0A7R8CMQ5_LEPSM|nr:USH1G [Lepeophtheirus salmonis]CAF2868628.1 USH1G [Lepeophtheirus salmonis]